MDLEVITKYLPLLLVLVTSIVIFIMFFKTYKKRKQTVEKFEEEEVRDFGLVGLVNEIRTSIMNNETEYQNNMNMVLEKISVLENMLVGTTQAAISKAVAQPSTVQTAVAPTMPTMPTVQPSVAQPQTAPTMPTMPTMPTVQPAVAQPQTAPMVQTAVAQPPIVQSSSAPTEPPLVFDEDLDDESNMGDEIVTETFIDGISCGSTANCAMF